MDYQAYALRPHSNLPVSPEKACMRHVIEPSCNCTTSTRDAQVCWGGGAQKACWLLGAPHDSRNEPSHLSPTSTALAGTRLPRLHTTARRETQCCYRHAHPRAQHRRRGRRKDRQTTPAAAHLMWQQSFSAPAHMPRPTVCRSMPCADPNPKQLKHSPLPLADTHAPLLLGRMQQMQTPDKEAPCQGNRTKLHHHSTAGPHSQPWPSPASAHTHAQPHTPQLEPCAAQWPSQPSIEQKAQWYLYSRNGTRP